MKMKMTSDVNGTLVLVETIRNQVAAENGTSVLDADELFFVTPTDIQVYPVIRMFGSQYAIVPFS